MNPPIFYSTISESINQFIQHIHKARSENTGRTYRNALNLFQNTLLDHQILLTDPIIKINEDSIAWFASRLKDFSPATERLYLTVAATFFEFLAANNLCNPNLPRMRLLIRQRMRRIGQRLPQFPANEIANIINSAKSIAFTPVENEFQYLRNLRDYAFLVTLADTGLRVHEACKLLRGDIDWFEEKAVIIGKGDQENIVRFSPRTLKAIKAYLDVRAKYDGASGKPLSSLPLFARHDRGAGKKIKQITTSTGRNIIAQRVGEILGKQAVGTITPHTFRHYFVTTVLRASGGNLKLAQELARHKNIAVTQRYAHLSNDELDKSYHDIFG